MKPRKGRYARGKAMSGSMRMRGQGVAMKGLPWKNPLRGDYKKIVSADVAMRGLGFFVGFSINL